VFEADMTLHDDQRVVLRLISTQRAVQWYWQLGTIYHWKHVAILTVSFSNHKH